MALTQIQIIQSLGEALSWYEKELGWGVSPGELNHLTGRIGELYAAMITRGQMAIETNQRGYDIITQENERASVKTIMSSSHVAFNLSTFDLVDRVMILRVNVSDEEGVSVEILEDCSAEELRERTRILNNKLTYSVRQKPRTRPTEALSVVAEVDYKGYRVKKFESQTIQVEQGDTTIPVSKPILRELASTLGVSLENGNGRDKNTRQLGADVIKAVQGLSVTA